MSLLKDIQIFIAENPGVKANMPPAVMIAHSTIFEPVRKEVTGYEIDPFGKHLFWQVDLKE